MASSNIELQSAEYGLHFAAIFLASTLPNLAALVKSLKAPSISFVA